MFPTLFSAGFFSTDDLYINIRSKPTVHEKRSQKASATQHKTSHLVHRRQQQTTNDSVIQIIQCK